MSIGKWDSIWLQKLHTRFYNLEYNIYSGYDIHHTFQMIESTMPSDTH